MFKYERSICSDFNPRTYINRIKVVRQLGKSDRVFMWMFLRIPEKCRLNANILIAIFLLFAVDGPLKISIAKCISMINTAVYKQFIS